MTTETRPAPEAETADVKSREFLSFVLGEVQYGIDILKVREIRGYDTNAVIPVANAPAHIKGVINLRGTIVPIVDLRICFRLEHVQYNQQTVVVILNIREHLVGIVVDGVSDVMSLPPEQIGEAPQLGSGIATRYLVGIATVGERMLLLVDIDELMSQDELELVEDAAV